MKTIQMFCILVILMFAIVVQAQDETFGPPELPYSIVHHDITADLNIDNNYLTAIDKLSLKREIKKAPSLTLLLRRGLVVSSVVYNDAELEYESGLEVDPLWFEVEIDSEEVAYYQRAQAIVIPLSEDITKKKQIELTLSYEGAIKDSVSSGEFSKDYVMDQITGVISRTGIYLGPEAIYYPTIPGQLFTFSIEASVQEPFQLVTEGALRELTEAEGVNKEKWVCDFPMDAIHIVGGQYQVGSVDHQGIEIATYFFPEQADLSERYINACKDYVDLYNELLGPYPFKKFAVVDNFFASGYGMPSFTLLGSQVLRLPFIIYTSLGHEICHNYWGNSVYVDYESGNWCEGLTTYCADYLYKERRSVDAAADYRLGLVRDYTAYTNQGNDFPLVDFRQRHNPAQRAIGYGKSAMTYHMLRQYVSDDDFWRSLRRFYNDNVWTQASWEDVQKAFEKESAMKLGWFFDQWIDSTGAPSLEIADPIKTKQEGTWQISFTLNQVQDGSAYILDVPMVVHGATQTAHMRAGVDMKSETVTLTTIFEPVTFAVDPNFDIFRRLALTETAPTLADVLGKSEIVVVLPSLASEDMQNAYKSFANQLSPPGSDKIEVIRDYEFYLGDFDTGAIIFLGAPSENQAVEADWITSGNWRVSSDSYWVLDQEYSDPHASVLAVERNPEKLEIPMAFYSARSVEDVLGVGQKLRHYGKYSYLVFQGDQNVAKGNWEVEESPLTHKF
jgi:aminopeptidase N